MFLARVSPVAACLAILLALPAVGRAQSAYKVGDKIQVGFLNEWRDGVVVQTNQRGEVLAEFAFGNSVQRRTFKPGDVRFQYEADALTKGRFWSDPSGKFRIKAALLKIGDKNITLRKQDLSEVDVAIDQLSDGDKSYLKKLQTEAQAAGMALSVKAPEPPPLEFFESGALNTASFGERNSRVAITPDPLPAYLKLKQGGVALPSEDFFDKIGALLPVGGPDGWLVASIENDMRASGKKGVPTRLLWVSLTKQKVESRQLLPMGETVIDYLAPARRLLTYAERTSGQGELTLWETMPTGKEATPVIRWSVKSSKSGIDRPWARILDASLVLQRTGRQEYVCWDTAAKRAKYRTTQESFFAPEAALSGGRKYVFMPEDQGVRILEAATGKFLSVLPQTDVSGVAPSDDGTQLAVLGRSWLTVWNLASGTEPPQQYQAETIGTPFAANIAWVSKDRLMVDQQRGQVLFSLKNRMTLWAYDFDHNATAADFFGKTRDIVDGHLVYTATYDLGSGHRGIAVGAVQLPGPKVDDAEKTANVEALYIVKAGTPVKLQVEAGEDTARVQKALEAKLMANGWTLDPNSPNVLLAEMKQGESKTIQYYSWRSGQAAESVTFTPHISSLKLTVEDKVAWQSGTSTGAPPIVTLRGDETVQGQVDKYQKPHPGFFDGVKIPQKILDPKFNRGLGVTTVTNRGLIPGSQQQPTQ